MIMTPEQDINYARIEQAILFLEKNFQHQPELSQIAEEVHLSPFHFQRLFTEWAGISPKRFLQYLTVDYLKKKLTESKNLIEAAESAGLSSQSRVYDLFTTLEAVTPIEYKQQGAGIRIEYGIHSTQFGEALIGVTERGVCWLSFIATDENAQHQVEQMKAHWNNSVFHQDQLLTGAFIEKIFKRPSPAGRGDESVQKGDNAAAGEGRIHLYVKGTNFQIKVWDALLKLPMGAVTTYQEIAGKIENPNALQAVGSAVGANHIAYLIPCHRVIRKDGVLGEYRWNSTRKKSIIGWEMAAAESNK
ncbi:MAG: methylated-DNA--[protein]-cysteine S-methyltransferase [Cyclobacteriaceae bacterium]|nr:methylated-DNA--[protein]-cysteine S-methyltransferase [Cyclobacteriaceae bacterium]